MGLIKLDTVSFPSSVSVHGRNVQSLMMGEQGYPVLDSLDYDDERRMIVAVVKGKGVVLMPVEQVAAMVPAQESKAEQIERERAALIAAEQKAALAAETERQRIAERARQAALHTPTELEAEEIRRQYRETYGKPGATPPEEATPLPESARVMMGLALQKSNEQPPVPIPMPTAAPPTTLPVVPLELDSPKPKTKKRGRPKKSDRGKASGE